MVAVVEDRLNLGHLALRVANIELIVADVVL